MARQEPRALSMEIDGREVRFPEGVTVLRAAELNGISIPSLCSHKDLSPFGGCRLCAVEVEGQRGYPLSCSTLAQAGMKVRTETATLRELRTEVLKLILSEHPSSCLICDERNDCRSYQGTIRKTGVTTGCRFCPNDGQCELQVVVEKIGLTEIDYPILYHGYEPELDDPFYDRDYNICILCGRCVRMCQEVRGTSVLAFTLRGTRAKVGPAFGRNHRQAGCEFCGACVDVCPTGALADKVSKWDGPPDGVHVSTCPFCAVGCQVELNKKNGRLSRVKAHQDPEVNDGQLCVRGRFCLPEVSHHFARARKPMLQKGGYFREVSWEEALGKVAGELKGLRPEEFSMLVSPDLTNEGLFAARKFVSECLGGGHIDSTARQELAGGAELWTKLFSLPISIKDIGRAEAILAVGLDSRFDFSVVGTKVRRALDGGARLVTIDPRDSNLARYTDDWLRPAPGQEGLIVKFLADRLSGKEADPAAVASAASVEVTALESALEALAASERLTVVIGPQVFHYGNSDPLVDGLWTLAERGKTNFLPLYFGANSRGVVEMGVLPEIGPGGVARTDEGAAPAELVIGPRRFKVVYLVGELPFQERPDCDFLVVQDLYLPPFQVDVFLPAASFAEAGGTLVNLEGRVQEVVQVEDLPEGALTGFMRPDWRIFADLANALNCRALSYKSSAEVFQDIRRSVPGFPTGVSRRPRQMGPSGPLKGAKRMPADGASGEFLLVAQPGGYRHRGVDISSQVAGLRELGLEDGLRMNPEDIAALGLKDGDRLRVSYDQGKITAVAGVKADDECPRKVLYYTRPVVFGGLQDRCDLRPFYGLVQNPVRVDVARAEG